MISEFDKEAALASTSLPGDQFFPVKADKATYAKIGHAVHGDMAAIPSLRTADEEEKTKVAERCIVAFDVAGLITAATTGSYYLGVSSALNQAYDPITGNSPAVMTGASGEAGDYQMTVSVANGGSAAIPAVSMPSSGD